MNERRQNILALINHKKKVSVTALSQLTNVSLVTIRNDLSFLEQQNYIKRTHGFAEILDRDAMSERMDVNFLLKQKLAKYALSFVKEGDSIFIEGGSTNALFARELLSFKGEIVVSTVCTYIALLLKEASFDVILFGGVLQTKSESVIGPLTRNCINQTHFNKTFIGTDGYNSEIGFTGRDLMRAEIINSVLDKGAENYIITDSSKFGHAYPYLLNTKNINHVITDSEIHADMEKALVKQKISVHKVSL